MSKIDDILLKQKRAVEHLEHFKATLFGRVGTVYPPHAIGIHFEPQRQDIAVTSDPLKPEQQRWLGVLIGDVIHQLRACLDHAVYALATRNGRVLTDKEVKNLEFLIRKTRTDFDADWRVSQGFFKSLIGVDELTVMESCQPYKRNPASPSSDPLWLLRELDNIDKHRSVLILENRVVVSGTAFGEEVEGTRLSAKFRFIKEPAKPNTEVFTIDWPHPGKPAAVSMDDMSRFVVFDKTDGLCDGREVFPLCRSMIEAVHAELIKFDRFFPF